MNVAIKKLVIFVACLLGAINFFLISRLRRRIETTGVLYIKQFNIVERAELARRELDKLPVGKTNTAEFNLALRIKRRVSEDKKYDTSSRRNDRRNTIRDTSVKKQGPRMGVITDMNTTALSPVGTQTTALLPTYTPTTVSSHTNSPTTVSSQQSSNRKAVKKIEKMTKAVTSIVHSLKHTVNENIYDLQVTADTKTTLFSRLSFTKNAVTIANSFTNVLGTKTRGKQVKKGTGSEYGNNFVSTQLVRKSIITNPNTLSLKATLIQPDVKKRSTVITSPKISNTTVAPKLKRKHRSDEFSLFNASSRTSSSPPPPERRKAIANYYTYGELEGFICPGYDSYAIQWNHLFPRFPKDAGLLFTLDGNQSLDFLNRKIIGLVSPPRTGFYEFELSCLDYCEFILLEDYKDFENGRQLDQFLSRFGVNKSSITEKNAAWMSKKLVRRVSPKPIFLKNSRKYLFDITSRIGMRGNLKLKWRSNSSAEFIAIDERFQQPLYENISLYPILPNIKYFNQSNVTKRFNRDPRNLFWKRRLLEKSALTECTYRPTYLGNYSPAGHIAYQVPTGLVYPFDSSMQKPDHNIFITDDKALQIANLYLKSIGRELVLQKVVHMEENEENSGVGKRYLMDIDVKLKNGSDDVYRLTDWIFVHKNKSLCRVDGFYHNTTENIYLLTPVKNQRRWIAFLLQELNKVVRVTGEQNIHLIIVDFNSTDADVCKMFRKAVFNYTCMEKSGKFNKVKGLNAAVKLINESDPIVFIFDLQLQFPLYLFDFVRKHTFRGLSAYVPIMLRTACAEHPEFTKLTSNWNMWMDVGYGMISLYKSDWIKLGGMNETQFGEKWGGEDWEFLERVYKAKYEVMHHRMPGYYHIYHETKGSWDGTKMY